MDTEIREWIIMIWEYCQEHWAAAIAAAVVLLILVISFFLVCTAKCEDAKAKAQAEELTEPEHEPTAEQSTEPVQHTEEPQQANVELAQNDTLETATEPVQQTASEQKTVQTALTDAVMKQLMRQVEEVSVASGQKVESIELNIEKARLTIRYAEEPAEESDDAKPQPKCTLELHDADAINSAEKSRHDDGIGTRAGYGVGTRAGNGAEIRAADGTSDGTGQNEESVMPRKFGMENMNRTKSGRVYTEDELLSQIKD